MKIIQQQQLWKYLLWLGLFFIVAGLTSGFLSEAWGIIPIAFLIIGIAILILWVVLLSQRNQWWRSRSTKASTQALLITLVVLVIVGLINFVGVRYRFRTDLTETQLFTLSPQSQQLVQNLQQPVKVFVFDGNQNPQDRELLETYSRTNSKFQFEYVDPQTKPGLAAKFSVKQPGAVYLESGNKQKLVQEVNVNDRLSETQLTNKLQQLLSDRTFKVYFVQGHGERSLTAGEGAISQAVQALNDKNYTSAPLNLTESAKVPDDANVVIVAGPKRGFFDAEVKALEDYLNRGGNALLLIEPSTNPNLNSLLQEWGVRLDDRLAVDVSGTSVQLGPATPIITDYGQHPITKDFGNGISFYPLARPLEITAVPGVQFTPLLKTEPYPKSWAESDLKSEKLEFNADKDLKGPLTLGVALTKKLPATTNPTPQPTPSPTSQTSPIPTTSPTPSTINRGETRPVTLATPSPTNQTQATPAPTPTPSSVNRGDTRPTTGVTPQQPEKTPSESRLVVIGSADFVADNVFTKQLNADVFLNSVSWLTQQDDQLLSIRPKEPKNRRITISTLQANVLTISALFVLPLIGLATATIIWWKRR